MAHVLVTLSIYAYAKRTMIEKVNTNDTLWRKRKREKDGNEERKVKDDMDVVCVCVYK